MGLEQAVGVSDKEGTSSPELTEANEHTTKTPREGPPIAARVEHAVACSVSPDAHGTYRINTNSKANLPTPMFWHKVLHQ
jgi:hypothetical protein